MFLLLVFKSCLNLISVLHWKWFLMIVTVSSVPFNVPYRLSCHCTGLHWPRGLQEVEAPRMFWQWAHEGGQVVRPVHWPPLPAREDTWYSFPLRGWVDPRTMMRLEGLSQWKISKTPLGVPCKYRLILWIDVLLMTAIACWHLCSDNAILGAQIRAVLFGQGMMFLPTGSWLLW